MTLGGWAAVQTAEGAPAFSLIFVASTAGSYVSVCTCVNHTMQKVQPWVKNLFMIYWSGFMLCYSFYFSDHPCMTTPSMFTWTGPALFDLGIIWLTCFSRVTYVSIWAASEPWLVNSANDQLLDSLDLGLWSAVPDIPEISHYISINCIAACMIYLCLFMWYGNPPFWVNYREWLHQYDWANDLGSVCPFLDRGM